MFNSIVRREQDLGALNLYLLATFNAWPVLLLMEFHEPNPFFMYTKLPLLFNSHNQYSIVMELTELSLASSANKNCNFTSSSDHHHHHQVDDFNFPSKKRKIFTEQFLNVGSQFQTSVDLQVKDPLPLDWEQCLDLESGRMYYMNRKTLKKTWNWPKDQKLDLELNISPTNFNGSEYFNGGSIPMKDSNNKQQQHSSSTNNMVALACLKCHLLIILSKSSPACPNCKFVHSLPTFQTTKSLNTLSLLN